jgi:bla regulator protein BlaR1
MSGAYVLLDQLVEAGGAVWRASWQASVLAVLVLAVQLMLGGRLPARWRHAMWMLVLVRLALPVVPSSPMSMFNLAPRDVPKRAPIVMQAEPAPILRGESVAAVRPLGSGERSRAAASRIDMPASAKPQAEQSAWSARELASGWREILALVWALGAIVLALRIAWATWGVSRMMRMLTRVAEPAIINVLRATAAELGVRRTPLLLAGEGFFSPALVGAVRPKLLVPSEVLKRFDPAELRLVFLHELAHLKRRDVAINWFATALTTLHWLNPVAWLVAGRLRIERELACDELVMSRTTDADRRAYGHTIVKLLEALAQGGSTTTSIATPLPAGGVGILEGKEQMKRRIVMIAQFARSSRTWTVVAAMIVLMLGLVALTDAVKAEDAPKPATQSTDVAVPGLEESRTEKPAALQPSDEDLAKVDAGLAQDFAELRKMQLEREELTRTLGADHPHVVAADAKIKMKQMQIGAQADALRKQQQRTSTTINPNDLVAISVMNLVANGVETTKTMRVDAEGNISLPYLGPIKAQGLKSNELEQAIAKAYKDKGVMEGAMVAVSLPERGESHQLAAHREPPAAAAQNQPIADGNFSPGALPAGAMQAPAIAQDFPIDPAMKAVLDKKMPEVKFDQIPLSDAIDFLRDTTSVNVFVNWRALGEVGVEQASPVTLKVRDVALKDVLGLMLRQLGDGLQFRTENGVIAIDVPNGTARPAKLVTKAYDVADLLKVPQLQAQPQQPDGMFGGVAQPASMDALTRTIFETVAPDSWRGAGGNGNISTYGTKLVVTASDEIHGEVASLLEMLRDKPTTVPADTHGEAHH